MEVYALHGVLELVYTTDWRLDSTALVRIAWWTQGASRNFLPQSYSNSLLLNGYERRSWYLLVVKMGYLSGYLHVYIHRILHCKVSWGGRNIKGLENKTV